MNEFIKAKAAARLKDGADDAPPQRQQATQTAPHESQGRQKEKATRKRRPKGRNEVTLRISVPDGKQVPAEWTENGRVKAEEFVAWMTSDYPPKRKGRYGAKSGFRDDLGFSLRSKLEANLARYLLFLGYVRWEPKYPADPPGAGRWFRYEGRRFEFKEKQGTTFYLTDYELWDEKGYHLYEAKGYLDPRSKTKLKRMERQYPHIRLELVTQPVLHDWTKRVQSLISNWE